MNKKIVANYLYNVSYQILLLLLPLVTTPYVSRVLGAANIGVYSFTQTVAGYVVNICQIGINLYGQREIAYVREDKEKVTILFKQLMFIRLITFSLGILFYIIFIVNNGQYSIYYQILLLYILGNFIDITWFFSAFEEFKLITIRNFIIRIISTAAIFLFVKSRNDLWIYVCIYSLCELVSQLSLWMMLQKKLTKVKFKLSGIFVHVKGSLDLFLPQVISTIYTYADKIVLGILSTEVEVGFYSQSEKIVKMALTLVTSLSTVMLPRIANIYGEKGKDDHCIEQLINKSIEVTWFVGVPLAFGLSAISKNFTFWFFGTEYSKVAGLIRIICPIILCIGFTQVFGQQFLIPTGRTKEYTVASAITALTNFALNIVLVRPLQSFGVSIATLIAEFSFSLFLLISIKKYINVRFWAHHSVYVSGFVMFILVSYLDNLFVPTALTVFAEILCGFLVYFFALFVLKNPLVSDFVKKIVNRRINS